MDPLRFGLVGCGENAKESIVKAIQTDPVERATYSPQILAIADRAGDLDARYLRLSEMLEQLAVGRDAASEENEKLERLDYLESVGDLEDVHGRIAPVRIYGQVGVAM